MPKLSAQPTEIWGTSTHRKKKWQRERQLRRQFAPISTIVLFLTFVTSPVGQIKNSSDAAKLTLTQPEASSFARLALKCVTKEFPNKPDHVINDAADLRSPKLQHPAFYGCYDWHSSVHGHW